MQELTTNNRSILAQELIQLRKQSKRKWKDIKIAPSTFYVVESGRSSPSIETLAAMLAEIGYDMVLSVRKV